MIILLHENDVKVDKKKKGGENLEDNPNSPEETRCCFGRYRKKRINYMHWA